MKAMHVVVATFAVLATASVARANIILLDNTTAAEVPMLAFIDLTAQGFGSAPRLLTLQGQGSSDFESGAVSPVNVVSGDAESGANKSTTPTLGTLGFTSGSEVGIGFNATEPSGNSPGAGITLQNLTLRIFDGTSVVGTFSTASPITFTGADLALQTGNGNGVFAFGLDAAQQAQFNAILSLAGSSNFRAALSSSLGCQAGAPAGCLASNGGPDSFVGFNRVTGTPTQQSTVPDGGSMATLLGIGLMGVAGVRYRLNRN